MPILHFSNYHKSYHNRTVLKIDNFLISKGIYWIKGINGSGKSTLLKTIAGILPFDGDIVMNDTLSIKKHPVEFRKVVNFAEAEPIFPSFLTGMEMVNLFASAKNAVGKQAEQYIESMKMVDYMGDPIATYSSGMIKKLSLVLAFLGNPELILLDEPLITMDENSLKILYGWINEAFHNKGISFLLSSHQMLDDHFKITKELIVEFQTITLAS